MFNEYIVHAAGTMIGVLAIIGALALFVAVDYAIGRKEKKK